MVSKPLDLGQRRVYKQAGQERISDCGSPEKLELLPFFGMAKRRSIRLGFDGMTRQLKTLEFWLIVLPILLVGFAVLAGFDSKAFARPILMVIIVTWTILAISWMFREIVRWVRGY